jgi:hypothetical protein
MSALADKTQARALDDGVAELLVVMRVVERISALRWRLDRIHRPTCVQVDILADFSFCTKNAGILASNARELDTIRPLGRGADTKLAELRAAL